MNNKEPIKLVTRKKLFIMMAIAVVGIGLSLYRLHRAAGTITSIHLAAAGITLVFALIAILVIAWWANRPEGSGRSDEVEPR